MFSFGHKKIKTKDKSTKYTNKTSKLIRKLEEINNKVNTEINKQIKQKTENCIVIQIQDLVL